jgi:N-methylhydantoinase A/oxoprolinase/acetone carboxylase beta subunit
VEKPALPDEREVDGEPRQKAARNVWWSGGWVETPIYEQEDVRAGNDVIGPAIIESPADTFAIPPGRAATLDRNRIFHLTTNSFREVP